MGYLKIYPPPDYAQVAVRLSKKTHPNEQLSGTGCGTGGEPLLRELDIPTTDSTDLVIAFHLPENLGACSGRLQREQFRTPR